MAEPRYAAVAYHRWSTGKETVNASSPGTAEVTATFLERVIFSLRCDKPATLIALNLFIVPAEDDVTPPVRGELSGPAAT